VKRLAHVIGATEVVLLVGLVVGAGVEGLVIGVLLGSATAVGWLLASRIPQNPLGWLLLFVAACFALAGPAYALGVALEDSSPGVAAWFFWYAGGDDEGWIWLPAVGVLFTQVLLRFPDGRLPSSGWRWFSRFTVALLVVTTMLISVGYPEVRPGIANPVYVPAVADNVSLVLLIFGVPLLVCFLVSAASLVVRYRRAGSVQRAQIRWVALAASLVVATYVLSFAVPGSWGARSFIDLGVLLMYALIPISIGVAVMRYRLYEIDRIVSRSISYAVVTVAVVALYAIVVTSLTRLVPGSSTVGVAVATLAAAAAFQPVLRRVRGAVDRRFDRRHYDAQHIVDSFGRSLRDEVDYAVVNQALVGAIEQTLAPQFVRVWTPPGTQS
jgi:hypothetical protein